VSTPNDIRWGVLGTGPMATAFVRALGRAPGASVRAVWSFREGAAAEFAARWGVARSYGSVDNLFADPEVDVVYVATVNTTHHDLCLRALDAGKPVLCEKPFALNAAEARAVVARARERKLFCMEAMWTRFLPAVVRLRQLLDDGAIGAPRLLSAQVGFPFVTDPAGRLHDPALGGGALLDMGVYLVSLAFHLFGPAESAVGRATLGATGVDEADAFVLAHTGGRLSVLAVSTATATPNEASVMGSAGEVRLHEILSPARLSLRTAAPVRPGAGGRGGRLSALEESAWFRAATTRLMPLVRSAREQITVPFEGNGYHHEAIEVMRCLHEGRLESPVVPLDETVAVLATMDDLRCQWGVSYPGE
jgi:predicted dehydrogenase